METFSLGSFQKGVLSFALKQPLTQAVAAAAAESLQSCPTLSDPMDCSPPGSSVHGILQARVQEWDVIAFSGLRQWIKMMFLGLSSAQ